MLTRMPAALALEERVAVADEDTPPLTVPAMVAPWARGWSRGKAAVGDVAPEPHPAPTTAAPKAKANSERRGPLILASKNRPGFAEPVQNSWRLG